MFEIGYDVVPTSWHPGQRINKADKRGLSTGYPVYFTSNGTQKRGFITAGHSYDVGDYVYRPNNTTVPLGICIASQNSGSVDAALIEITDPYYEIESTTYYENAELSPSYAITTVQNTTIHKEGQASEYTYGLVIDDCYSAYSGSMTDMIKASTVNISGDSGGVAYMKSGNRNIIVGSMSGSARVDENGEVTYESFEYSIITKAENTLNAFNCSVWP